jgi:endoglucanase
VPLSSIDANRDVWIGWTWWAGGPWWDDYMFALDPVGTQDRPQLPILLKHL